MFCSWYADRAESMGLFPIGRPRRVGMSVRHLGGWDIASIDLTRRHQGMPWIGYRERGCGDGSLTLAWAVLR